MRGRITFELRHTLLRLQRIRAAERGKNDKLDSDIARIQEELERRRLHYSR